MSANTTIKLSPMQTNQANICRRRAVAEARTLPPENEPATPEPTAENRRRAAARLAPMVLEHMAENGWQHMEILPAATHEIDGAISVKVPLRHLMSYNPDQDVETTYGEEVRLFEVLVRIPGPGRRVTVASRGAANAYYDEIAAVAAVQPEPREIVVAVYNSDDGEVSTHRISHQSIEEMKYEWSATIRDLAEEAAMPGELPDPENAYDAPACRSCQHRLSCPAQQKPPVAEDPDLDEDTFAEALEQWLYANEKVGELRGYEKTREAQRDQMMKMMTDNDITEITFHDNSGQPRLIKIGTQQRNSPNYKMLQEALTPAQYNEMVPRSTSQRFTVAKG